MTTAYVQVSVSLQTTTEYPTINADNNNMHQDVLGNPELLVLQPSSFGYSWQFYRAGNSLFNPCVFTGASLSLDGPSTYYVLTANVVYASVSIPDGFDGHWNGVVSGEPTEPYLTYVHITDFRGIDYSFSYAPTVWLSVDENIPSSASVTVSTKTPAVDVVSGLTSITFQIARQGDLSSASNVTWSLENKSIAVVQSAFSDAPGVIHFDANDSSPRLITLFLSIPQTFGIDGPLSVHISSNDSTVANDTASTQIHYADGTWEKIASTIEDTASNLIDVSNELFEAFYTKVDYGFAEATAILNTLSATLGVAGLAMNWSDANTQYQRDLLAAAALPTSTPEQMAAQQAAVYAAGENEFVNFENKAIEAYFAAKVGVIAGTFAATAEVAGGILLGMEAVGLGIAAGTLAVAVIPVAVGVAAGIGGYYLYENYLKEPNAQALKTIYEVAVPVQGPVVINPEFHGNGHGGDGYLSGSLVFADANGNGIFDPGEASTNTDSNGNFKLSAGSGPLVLTGGTDVNTHLVFAGSLRAPEGSAAITPLTTVLCALQDQGLSLQQAKDALAIAFGLGSGVDITVLDPLAGSVLGDPSSLPALLVGAKVYDTVVLLTSAIGVLSNSPNVAGTVFATLAAEIAAGSPTDLSNQANVSALIVNVAQALGIDVTSITDQLATLIGASNGALDQTLQADGSGSLLLSDVSAIENIAQGSASLSLQQDGGDLSKITQTVSDFTGSNLDSLIFAANLALVSGAAVASITGVSASGTNHAHFGEAVTITVTTTAPVFVFGSPTLHLSNGGIADYAGNSGVGILNFTYTPQSGDAGGELQVTGLDLLPGTNIVDGNGNPISGAVAGDLGLQLLSALPTSIASANAFTDVGASSISGGHLVTITIGVTAPVTVSGIPTLQLSSNELAFFTGTSGSSTLQFSYVTLPSDNSSDLQAVGVGFPNGASIVDANGDPLAPFAGGDLGLSIAGKLTLATVAQEVNALYVTLYGIAATDAGIVFWENVLHDFDASVTTANAASTAVSLNDQTYLGEQMTAGSPIVNNTTYFATLYPTSMSDMDYVKALYQNMSNFIGTVAGDNYWFAVLQQAETTNGGDVIGARESIAGQFVHDFLSNDLTIGAAALNVTPSDYALLVNGQQALLNRALISQDYANETVAPGGSIINFTTVTSPAFAAAHNVVAAVTSDPASVAVAITGINNAIAHQDLSLI